MTWREQYLPGPCRSISPRQQFRGIMTCRGICDLSEEQMEQPEEEVEEDLEAAEEEEEVMTTRR